MSVAIALSLVVIAAPTPFSQEIAAGRSAYEAMALEGALTAFERAQKKAKSVEEDVTAHVWIGVVLVELGRFKDAELAFVRAIEQNREAALPEGVPPKTRGLFEAAHLRVDPPPPPTTTSGPLTPVVPIPALPPREPFLGDRDVGDDDDSEAASDDELTAAPDARPQQQKRTPWLLVGSGAVAGGALLLAGTGGALDVAAGPDALDGGIASNALYGAAAALLVTAAALAIVGVVAE